MSNAQKFCHVLNKLRHVDVISDITKMKLEIRSQLFENFSNMAVLVHRYDARMIVCKLK